MSFILRCSLCFLLSLSTFLSNAQNKINANSIIVNQLSAQITDDVLLITLQFTPNHPANLFDKFYLSIRTTQDSISTIWEQQLELAHKEIYNSSSKTSLANIQIPIHQLQLPSGNHELSLDFKIVNSMNEYEDTAPTSSFSIKQKYYPSIEEQSFHLDSFYYQYDSLWTKDSVLLSHGLFIKAKLSWDKQFPISQEGYSTYNPFVKLKKQTAIVAQKKYNTQDSILTTDSLVYLNFFIPYYAINLTEGIHNLNLYLGIEGYSKNLLKRQIKLQQIPIYDLKVDLNNAEIYIEDLDPEALEDKDNYPDPISYVQLPGVQSLESPEQMNRFKLDSSTFYLRCSDVEALKLGVYDRDLLLRDTFGEIAISLDSGSYRAAYELDSLMLRNIQIEVEKQRFVNPSAKITIEEDYEHLNMKGLRINCSYEVARFQMQQGLSPYLKDINGKEIENTILLEKSFDSKLLRPQGKRSYFISYLNLLKTKKVVFSVTAGAQTIIKHSSKNLKIVPPLSIQKIQQKNGHILNGISGILYEIQYKIREVHPQGQYHLIFPQLSELSKNELRYWTKQQSSKILGDSILSLGRKQGNTIFVFLPYYAAPKVLEFSPKMYLKTVHNPAYLLAEFQSTSYKRPVRINDIQITTSHMKDTVYTGMAGKFMSFSINVPKYYQNKGTFKVTILENGKRLKRNFFINDKANANADYTIKNQKEFKVFIPYRLMEEGARYQIKIESFSHLNFPLSEIRQLQFDNPTMLLVELIMYMQQIKAKGAKEFTYKIRLRNGKNINRTYEEIGYEIVLEETVKASYKAGNNPKSCKILVHPKDEISLWIQEANAYNSPIIKIKTTYEELLKNKYILSVKNLDFVQKAILKSIERK